MLDDTVSYRILDEQVYKNYRDYSLDWLEMTFSIDLPTKTAQGDAMGEKSATLLWEGQGKQYQRLVRRIKQYLARWLISEERFCELAGVPIESVSEMLGNKPRYRLTRDEYHKIFHQLERPLEIIPKNPSIDVLEILMSDTPPEPVPNAKRVTVTLDQAATAIDGVPRPIEPDPAPEPADEHAELKARIIAFAEYWQIPKTYISKWSGYSSTYLSQFLYGPNLKGSKDFLDRMLEMLTHPEDVPQALRQHSPVWKRRNKKAVADTPPEITPETLPETPPEVPQETPIPHIDQLEEPVIMPLTEPGPKPKWVFTTHQLMRTTYVLEADSFAEASKMWENGQRGQRMEHMDSLSVPEVQEVKRYDPGR